MSEKPFKLFGVECGHGWASLYNPVLDLCAKHNANVFQVKQKFGALRIYVDYSTAHTEAQVEEIEQAVRHAENESMYVCEECGRAGELINQNGWLSTVCKDHRGGLTNHTDDVDLECEQ